MPAHARHPHIPLPRDLYGPARHEFGGRRVRRPRGARRRWWTRSRSARRCRQDASRAVAAGVDPARARWRAAAAAALPRWNATPVERRAAHARARRRTARGIARHADRAAAVRGRQDARRCAVRSARGGRLSAATTPRRRGARWRRSRCRGRPARRNELHYRGRGVFVCISPWNFPLAIFLGQVAAALAAGNAVVAKPAEQTPLIARRGRAPAASRPACRRARCISCRATARSARRWSPTRASPASPSPARPRSARAINRALAAKDGPIVPLIAETGGINAMIVDATALPEQVTDDVVTSAFRSAGQRCSALRLLCVQEDVADRMIEMIAGAAQELVARRSARSGDPCRPGDRRRGEGSGSTAGSPTRRRRAA